MQTKEEYNKSLANNEIFTMQQVDTLELRVSKKTGKLEIVHMVKNREDKSKPNLTIYELRDAVNKVIEHHESIVTFND